MDSALVLITLASLGTTGAVLFYAARLIRDERTRSNARVTALAEEIGHVPAGTVRTAAPSGGTPLARSLAAEQPRREPPPGDSPGRAVRSPVRPGAESPRRAGHDPLADAALFAERPSARSDEPLRNGHAAARATLFESASTDSPSNRWLVPVIGAMIVVLALTTIYFVSGQPEAPVQAARAGAGATNVPLELVALAQARKGDILTVSGTVRNPPTAIERRQLAAVVFVFDRNGSFVASGRAPLDYQALAPGDESPFVITVPGAAAVSRYRVSFREADDVLPHVDRREPPVAGQPAGAQ